MHHPTEERAMRVGHTQRSGTVMEANAINCLHLYILDYLRKKKYANSAAAFCVDAGLDPSAIGCTGGGGSCPLLDWWFWSWESRQSLRGTPTAGNDLVVRTQQIEGGLGQELGSEASPKVLMDHRQRQIQKLLIKKREAQASEAAAQARMMQRGQDIHISVPWPSQQQYILQRELQQAQRQEQLIASLSGEPSRKGSLQSSMTTGLPDGLGRRSETWVQVSGLQQVEQGKRIKVGHPQVAAAAGGPGGLATGAGGSALVSAQQQQQQLYSQLPSYNIAQERGPADVAQVQQQVAPSEGKPSIDATPNSSDPNLKLVPVGSGGASYLSGTVPQGSSLTTLMQGSNVAAQQAIHPHLGGRQILANGSGHNNTPYSRQILLQRYQAMQQLKRLPGQLVANGTMPGLGVAGNGSNWGDGQGSTSAYSTMLLKSVQGQGFVGQGQNMIFSPQLSAVGDGSYTGPLNGMSAKADDMGSSMNPRLPARSPQLHIQYNGATGESKNVARRVLGVNGIAQLSSTEVKADIPSVGVVPNIGTAGVPLNSPRPVAPMSQDQNPVTQLQTANGNSSSVASTDGPGASHNGTPESKNPAEKNLPTLGFDAIRDGGDNGIEKGLAPCFATGENCDLENGGGALDDGSAGSPFKGPWQEGLQSPFCDILRPPSPVVYGDAKFDSLDLELELS